MNGEDVTAATHGHVVELIKKSGNSVTLTVITAKSKKASVSGSDNTDGPRKCGTPVGRFRFDSCLTATRFLNKCMIAFCIHLAVLNGRIIFVVAVLLSLVAYLFNLAIGFVSLLNRTI